MDMIHINLLPKEYRRKRGGLAIGKSGLYAVGAVAGVIVLIAVISFYQIYQIRQLDDKMEEARFRTKQLQKDIAVVDALTDVKGKIMQRMTAVDRLDQHRIAWVRILEDINRNMPQYTWLQHFEVKSATATTKDKSSGKDNNRKKDKQADEEKLAKSSEPAEKPSQVPVELEGYSFTLSAVANLMINMMNSHYFSDVEMQSINEMEFKEQKAYNYKMTATLHYLSDKELNKLLEQESGPDILASF